MLLRIKLSFSKLEKSGFFFAEKIHELIFFNVFFFFVCKENVTFAAKLQTMDKIVISKADRKLLNSKYGTWNVSRALNYRCNSFLCREIRKVAINLFYGKKISYKKVSEESM